VRQRYGERLTAAELEAVRAGVATIVDAVRALRAVRLENADGPALPRFPTSRPARDAEPDLPAAREPQPSCARDASRRWP
jgi:hypothetical protein